MDQYDWECTCGAAWKDWTPEYDGDAPDAYGAVKMFLPDLGWTHIDHGEPFWDAGRRYRFQPVPPPGLSGNRADSVIVDDVEETSSLPEDDGARLAYPMFDGLLAYFPNALAEVAMVSMLGNQQHNPGQPMHWARGKSTDHENKIIRHLVDAGKRDARGVRHSARVAWRALALLQEELERDEGYPMSRASRPADDA